MPFVETARRAVRLRRGTPGHLRRVILHHTRRGAGAPLVLVHGLGGSLRSWDLVVDSLAAHRDVVALDLPGFGGSPALPETTVATLADALALFLSAQGLQRADLVGTSLGGRLVLEMVRRGLGRLPDVRLAGRDGAGGAGRDRLTRGR